MSLPKIWIICRVCLQQQEKMFNLFDSISNKNIWLLLRDCGGVPVRRNDDLPDKICVACLRRLYKAIDFRIDCQRSHRELVQMHIERDGINEIDLKEEVKYSSEFLMIPYVNDDYRHLNPSVKLEQQISTEPEEKLKNEIATINDNKSIECESNNRIIKEYCIVKSNDRKENNPEKTNKTQGRKPIVLLLKLKNFPVENNHAETKKTEESTKTIHNKLKINLQNSKKESNKADSKINKNSKIKCEKTNKLKLKGIAKSKLKSILNRRKSKFTCKVCKKTYKSNVLLRHHGYIHKRPHQCKICNKRFSQIHSFVSHNNKHTGIKPYYCRICYQTFADISNRNSHERNGHKKQEFKCEICNKIFRFLALLQKHAQSHRPKKCFICNKEFASLQMVRCHHQRKHLNIKN